MDCSDSEDMGSSTAFEGYGYIARMTPYKASEEECGERNL